MNKILVTALSLLAYANVSVADTALPFQVYEASYESIDRRISIDAVVEAVNVATVSSQVSGRVIGVNFDVDDKVQKGQILVRLASREQRAKVDEIEAKELEAQAQYNIDYKELNRIRQLFSKKLMSKSVLDKAEAKIRRSKERLNSAAARLRDAENKLRYAVVRAPYTGVVVKRHIELGELAKVGQPLMTGLSLGKLRVSAYIPQRYVNAIRNNKQVHVSFSGLSPMVPVVAKSISVSPQADADSHSFVVRVVLPEAIKHLYPGMFAKLNFSNGVSQKLLVPNQAIVKRSELKALYVIDNNNQVQLRQVRLGRHYPDAKTEILAGLREGERIALDPTAATTYLKRTP